MDGDVDPSPHRPSPCPAIRWVRPRQRASPSGSRQTLATGSQSARAVDDDLHRGLAFLPLRVHAVAHADWRVPVLCRPAARAGAARVQLLDHARSRCWRSVHLPSSPGGAWVRRRQVACRHRLAAVFFSCAAQHIQAAARPLPGEPLVGAIGHGCVARRRAGLRPTRPTRLACRPCPCRLPRSPRSAFPARRERCSARSAGVPP